MSVLAGFCRRPSSMCESHSAVIQAAGPATVVPWHQDFKEERLYLVCSDHEQQAHGLLDALVGHSCCGQGLHGGGSRLKGVEGLSHSLRCHASLCRQLRVRRLTRSL